MEEPLLLYPENYIYKGFPSWSSFSSSEGNQRGFFMPIYTKTGDKGDTGIYTGKRISKDSPRIEAIGEIDELNSVIGAIIPQIKNQKSKIKNELIEIQRDLFTIGSSLANPTSQKTDILKRVSHFEKEIDKMTAKLPKLFNFILPGGGTVGAFLHLARTVARRAERRIITLSKKENIDREIIIYVNRLSDLFLTMSRFVNHLEKKEEIIWKT